MEAAVSFFILILYIWYLFSRDSSPPDLKITLKVDEALKKWKEESSARKTALSFNDWKNLQVKNASIERVKAQKILFIELLERGIEHQHVARRGVIRSNGPYSDYFSDFAKSVGIHPEEAALLKRKEKAQAILEFEFRRVKVRFQHSSGPTFFDQKEIITSPATVEERLAANEELKIIDYEWSQLNNRLLDEYFLNAVKDVSRNDFVCTFHPPKANALFPYSAGQWHAISKLWGINLYDKTISPINGSSTSRNHALFQALANIKTRKEKHNDLVPVPINPWDADL